MKVFYFKKKAFTLVELLIVIVIIAILAGGVLPYFRQYVEESKITRAKQDLDEVKNALIRYENDQRKLYAKTDTSDLTGAYLMTAKPDPWGAPYVVNSVKSLCYSLGPDGIDNTQDEVKVYFRPPLAITRVTWEDTNKSMQVDTGDCLVLRFPRPIDPAGGPSVDVSQDDLTYSNGWPESNYSNKEIFDNHMAVRLTLDFTANPVTNPPFRAGQDTVKAKTQNGIKDAEGTPCIADQATIIRYK